MWPQPHFLIISSPGLFALFLQLWWHTYEFYWGKTSILKVILQNQNCTVSSSISDCDRMRSQSRMIDLDHVSVPSYSLLHEPFKSIPVVWTVHEYSLAHRIKEYNASGMIQIIDAWKEVFSRANVVVFPNYILPVFNYNLIVISRIILSFWYGWRSSNLKV